MQEPPTLVTPAQCRENWIMNTERPNEKDAKRIVETMLGVELDHADGNGGVDYRSSDKQLVLEVTRVTDGLKKSTRHAGRVSRDAASPDVELQNCWLVFVSDTQPGMKTIRQVLPPLFAQLEAVGETHFDRQQAAVHAHAQGPLRDVVDMLVAAGVERASGHAHDGGSQHRHRVIVSLGSGGTASGSDDSAQLLIAALAEKTDNVAKLAESDAPERHLFVWIDDDTRFDIARPLSRVETSGPTAGFGVPSIPPVLDPAITHLWVVHEDSRLGWLWNGERWRELGELN